MEIGHSASPICEYARFAALQFAGNPALAFAICDVKIPFARRTLIDQMIQGFATEPKARPYGWVGLAVSLIAIPIVAVLVSIAPGAKTSLRET